LLARDWIVEERKDIEGGLLVWKILQKLKIFPED
jgi:hypothetical protein